MFTRKGPSLLPCSSQWVLLLQLSLVLSSQEILSIWEGKFYVLHKIFSSFLIDYVFRDFLFIVIPCIFLLSYCRVQEILLSNVFLNLCSLIGATVIVIGFYSVMWGKTTEEKIDEDIGVSRLESTSQDAPLLQNYIDGSSLPKYN